MKTCLFVAVCLAAAGAGAYDFYNIMPFSPGREKEVAADCVAYAKKTGNTKILYSLTLHPEGRPAMAKAEAAFASYRALREALKGTEIELGILIQSIIGHWPRVDKEIEPWMRTVNLDGEVVRFCPLDPGFAAYIREIGRRCAAERPFFILTDDDVRAFSHRPECFCERHRKLFSERIGRDYTSDEMRQAVTDCHPGDKVYETFVRLQREMVDGIVRLVREGIDSVDPTIPAGIGVVGQEQRYCGSTARAIAAKGQRPVMRLPCANYCEVELRSYPWNVLRVLSRAGYWEDAGIDLLDESDTYPHNYWSKTALALHTHQVNAILAGMKGAKLWFVGAHKQGFPVNPGYAEILAENAGLYRTLAAAAEGSRFLGLVAPCQRRVPDGPFPTVAKGILAGDSCVTFQAGQYGVPIATTYDLGRRDVVYSLSSAKQVEIFNDEELRTIFAGRVLVDGDGALALAKRGFADLLGCDVEPGATGFTREQDAATGRAIVLAPVDKPAKLTAHPGSRVLSWLVYSPYHGAETVEKVHPGALVFTNRLGGVVVTAAFQHETPYHHSYSESRKRWFVDCMDALNGGFTPFVCGAANPTCAMAKRLRDGSALVAVVNTCFEGMKSLPLRLPADVRRVEQLLPNGAWKELPFVRDADGYADLPIALPCYGMVVVRVNMKPGEKGSAFSCEGYETRPILSPWGEKVTPENAWREYPRPQMVRKAWTSLNGLWQYAIIPADEDVRPTKFDGEILVPFGPEAVLSGVRRKVTEKDQVWYRRTFAAEPRPGTRTLVNFECVDFRAQVFVNGREATDVPHAGSAAPFTVDVTRFLRSGENVLEVCAWDPCCSHIGTTGKQMLDPIGSFHPAESGICGSVWMETVPETYIRGYKVVTDTEDSTVKFDFDLAGDGDVTVKVDGVLQSGESGESGEVVVRIPNAELWSPENPKLYEFTAKCGEDEIRGYFGMRKFGKAKDAKGIWRFTLNGRFVYLLGALDQGWWPDGLLTPPSEEAVRADVDFLKACGFNTIRKHIKVEPRVFYAHCDRVGMLVVQDMPCGGGDYDHRGGVTVQRWGMFRRELKDMVDSLWNHPSIVMWAPFNEGWGQPRAEKTRQTYLWLRDYDPTRLLDGPSGWNEYLGGRVNRRDFKGTTQVPSDPTEEYADAIDIHEYPGPAMWPVNPSRVSFLGEFGGTYAHVAGHTWLDQPTTVSNQIARGEAARLRPSAEGWKEKLASVYEGITAKLVPLVREGLGGSIYTQAQDVGIECGGFITYDRKVPKFDPEFLRKVHQRVYEAFDEVVR